MNSEDMSDNMKNLSNMLNSNNIPDNLKEMLNQVVSSKNSTNSENSNDNNNNKNSDGSSNSINPEMISNMINMLNNNNSNNSSNTNSSSSQNANSGIDIEMLMKMKSIMDKMNSGPTDPRANLLLSLKPYLKESRKSKVDQYAKLFSMSKVMDLFNNMGGEKKK